MSSVVVCGNRSVILYFSISNESVVPSEEEEEEEGGFGGGGGGLTSEVCIREREKNQ